MGARIDLPMWGCEIRSHGPIFVSGTLVPVAYLRASQRIVWRVCCDVSSYQQSAHVLKNNSVARLYMYRIFYICRKTLGPCFEKHIIVSQLIRLSTAYLKTHNTYICMVYLCWR